MRDLSITSWSASPARAEVERLLAHLHDTDWMLRASCRGRPDLFFGPTGERPQTRKRREARARNVCVTCPVVDDCRSHAHETPEYGMWGGESEDDRAALGVLVPAPGRSRT